MDVAKLPDTPFAVSMARQSGLGPGELRRALEQNVVKRVLHGVYLRADVPLTTELRLDAAFLVISPHSVVCDRTAAWIWAVDAYVFRELDQVPPLETFVLRGHDPTDRPEIRGGTRDLMTCDWIEIRGVKVTTPLRTALDLGCVLPRREAVAAMDALMRAHGFTRADMVRLLARYRRRRGVVQLRQLVPIVDPRAESPMESWTRVEMLDHGLPSPTPQFWVMVDGIPTYRLDLAYPHARIAIEYDGQEFHSGPADRERDRTRRTWLREHGWTVVVLDRRAFGPEGDHAWVREIRTALAHAQRVVRRSYAS
jgi:hypothetical protein